MNAAQVLHDKYMIWCGEQLWSAFVLATVVALVICLITFFVVSWILGRQGKQQSEKLSHRWSSADRQSERRCPDAEKRRQGLRYTDWRPADHPGFRNPELLSARHWSGPVKSEVIRRLANYARQRGDMVVIYDRSGEFVKSYLYDPSIDKS